MSACSTNVSRHVANRTFNEQRDFRVETDHTFLMRRLSSSTYEILVRAGGGYCITSTECKDDVT